MAEDRLDTILRELERDPEPDPAFAEHLYRQLAAEAGLGAVHGSSWLKRIRQPTTVGGILLRPVWLVLIVLLILVAMLGLLMAGGAKPRPDLGIMQLAPSAAPAPDTSTPTPGVTLVPMERPSSGVLNVGQRAPAWSAALLDGGSLDSRDLAGRPAALYFWCSCVSGPQPRLFAAEASARAGEMTLVLASLEEPGMTRGLVDSVGYDAPVIGDARPLLDSWAMSYWPVLVLLRADGAVADLQPVNFSSAKLSAMLDALAAGQPIPDPDPRVALPEDTNGRLALSSILNVGQPAPELRGPGLDGREHSTLDLIGRASIVLHWMPPDAAGNPPGDDPGADRLIAELTARADSVNGLLVARGEQSTGDVAGYMAAQGSELPVIFDWSGELFSRWGLVYWPTLVGLDADGRVAALGDRSAVASPSAFIDALLTPRRGPVASGQ